MIVVTLSITNVAAAPAAAPRSTSARMDRSLMGEGRAGIALEARVAVGALLVVALAALIAPLIRPLFHETTGAVGFVTVHHYPKSWDYAVVILLVIGSFAGGTIASIGCPLPARGEKV